ncbi:hypothetical protein GCK72_001584 [Caenorhabditis remanei]|uniref:Uncharacterized protein n=1 Tax=Caenorhabditis remanei TaxID=31234 RepID=A0A6A5HTW5_CAERE|nr:hypothetical protein GCK72_001584 [Caenorhabditis remanei]KAF1769767.1 hypothetical protein GCK72_001584 [Caenorhabditis remanei]
MEVKNNTTQDYIARSLNATEKAIELIRDGDIVRRHVTLDIRDMHISISEDMERFKGMLKELEQHIDRERIGNTRWMDRKVAAAKAMADHALSSTLMVKDVQCLEKKVNILKESVIQMNKSYMNYEKNVDLDDLKDQVTEMVRRVENKEKEAMDAVGTDEPSIEQVFRGAIEGLYGLQSKNPKLMEEAKQLAKDLSIFRDAAANRNFYDMISSAQSTKTSSGISTSSVDKSSVSTEKPFSPEATSDSISSTASSSSRLG